MQKQIEEIFCDIVVQINGRKRGLINTTANISEAEIMELIYNDQKIAKYLKNFKIKKQIHIKNRLINIII